MKVRYTSRWLNAVLVHADSEKYEQMKHYAFVKASEVCFNKSQCLILSHKATTSIEHSSKTADENYGNSYNQFSMVGIDLMHADGFRGEGMLIALLDAGFPGVDQLPVFDYLRQRQGIIGTFDFVAGGKNVYGSDLHGTTTLSLLAAYLPGQLIGGAYKADYLLLRTEDVSSEKKIEEVNWALAAEYADSAGADIISSSLGYNTFDDPSTNYGYKDLDGQTAIITKAAEKAAAAGMLVVNSAGNDGSDEWKYIFAPADGDSVLSVGAVDGLSKYASFSSVGPTYDGRVKPDVAAQGDKVYVAWTDGTIRTDNGTSFSCPIVAGLAAGIWQANPSLSNMQLMDVLKRSASQYEKPDNLLGYGIPSYIKTKTLLYATEREDVFMHPLLSGNSLELWTDGSFSGMPCEVTLHDLSGKLVMQKELLLEDGKSIVADLSAILSGVYIASVITGKGKRVFKIVK